MAKKPKSHSPTPSMSAVAAHATQTGTSEAQRRLKLLVFVAGAVLMGLEIAGSRVLAPHFGNSVFVWGSLISVFLTALSVGYYLGGMVADRFPSRLMLGGICVGVGLWIIAVALVAYPFCESLALQGAGEQSGPLLSALVLFLPPSVGMGMVSPLAIRLGASSLANIGKIAGTLYALSTLGSIAGTLLTTFLLVPIFGVTLILKGLGAVLIFTAIATLPSVRARSAAAPLVGALLLATAGIAWSGPRQQALLGEDILVDVDTPYHHITVVDNQRIAGREMRFDRFVESAVALQPPHATLCEYTKAFHLALLVKPDIQRVLFIGAGGAVGPRAFRMHSPTMQIDMVDIDPKVLELTRTHFFLAETDNVRAIARDGRMFVREIEQPYDCIILDAFSIGGRIPFHLVTREFFELCRDKLTGDGVFLMNINSAVSGPRAGIYQSITRTLREAFAQVYPFALHGQFNAPEQSTNVILVATRSPTRITPSEWAQRAMTYRSNSYVGPDYLLGTVGDLIETPELGTSHSFTDDYAPIEGMPF